MADATAQLTLGLFEPGPYGFEAYRAGVNGEAVAALRRWCRGDGPAVVYLWGVAGSGKSHLLQAALGVADAARAMYLPLAELAAAGPAVLDDLAEVDVLAIDDLDAVAGSAAWEQRLFHLYNAVTAAAGRLLWAGRQAPAARLFALPDLASRHAASLAYPLHELDDADKAALLEERAAARGLRLPPAVTDFIMRRQRRDMRTLVDLVDELDRVSLSRGRLLTIPFVREVLAERDARG